MRAKPVVPRQLARNDVEAAIDYCADDAGETIASRFVDALERAYAAIGRSPSLGSLLHAHALNLPGLRTRRVGRFPYLVFYVESGHDRRLARAAYAARYSCVAAKTRR